MFVIHFDFLLLLFSPLLFFLLRPWSWSRLESELSLLLVLLLDSLFFFFVLLLSRLSLSPFFFLTFTSFSNTISGEDDLDFVSCPEPS